MLWIALCALPFSRRFTETAGGLFDHYAIYPAVPLLLAMAAGAGLFLSREAPEFPAVPYNKALEYFTAEDYEKAIQMFRGIQERHGQSLIAGETAYHLAMCYYRMKNWPATIRELEFAMEKFPDSPRAAEIRYHMGLCKIEQKRYGQARQAFDRTLEEFPGTIWGRLAAYQHAMSLYREQRYAQTVESLDRLLSLAPERGLAAEAFYHRGLCFMQLGEGREARQDFLIVRERYGDFLWAEYALYQAGLSYFREQDFDNTASSMKELLRPTPPNRPGPGSLVSPGIGAHAVEPDRRGPAGFHQCNGKNTPIRPGRTPPATD